MVNESKIVVKNYDGIRLNVLGTSELSKACNEIEADLEFVIIDTIYKSTPMLGINTIKLLNLLKRNICQSELNEIKVNELEKIINENKEVFVGLGKMKQRQLIFG